MPTLPCQGVPRARLNEAAPPHVRHFCQRGGAARRGQAIVELALIAPIMVVLLVAIVDLARIYTTMLGVESAAREAADYGAFGSQKWNVDIYDSDGGVVSEMQRRACAASSTLTDYRASGVPSDYDCTNPTFAYELSADRGASWVPFDPGLGCDNATREPPCWVRVTLSYDFSLLVPLHIDLFGASYGVPDTLTFERSAIFAMTDLQLP